MPDLASTLGTEADAELLHFLRSRSHTPLEGQRGPDETLAHIQRPRDLNRDRLRRLHAESRQQYEQNQNLPHPAYGDRIPRRQSLYDWAPDGQDDHDALELWNSLIPSNTSSTAQDESTSSIAQFLSDRRHASRWPRRPSNSATTSREAADTISTPTSISSTLVERDRRLAQQALRESQLRRHNDLYSTQRAEMTDYIRESSSSRSTSPLPSISSTRPRTTRVPRASGQAHRPSGAEIQGQIDAYRQRYLSNPTLNAPAPPRELEEAIKYLDKLRRCNSFSDSLRAAAKTNLVGDDFRGKAQDDFILSITHIPSPAETSWLRPGGIFDGSQHAATPIPRLNHRSSTSATSTTIDPRHLGRRAELSSSSFTRESLRAYWNEPSPLLTASEERWPVKVSIQAIDWEKMTLCGTMEAFGVPDWQAQTQKSSIVTFLEGEIVDLDHHSFLTTNFKADPKVDATYWRKLEPFKDCSDEEVGKRMASRAWMREECAKKYVLMRWKGQSCRCHSPFSEPFLADTVLEIQKNASLPLRTTDLASPSLASTTSLSVVRTATSKGSTTTRPAHPTST